MFKRILALAMILLSALSSGLAEAQVLEWTAHTRGRMIDVYAPGESPEHLLATGLTMATLAIAAYDDDPVGRGLDVRGAHYEEVHFESEPTTDAQALVVRDNRALVVAFRGSESRLDWAGDLATVTDVGRDRGAHLGFAMATRSVASRLTTVLRNELSRGAREVWLTGHSLGGAMAQIFARYLALEGIAVAGVVTFGAPAPGHSEWSATYAPLASRTHRFENAEDLVPCLPPNRAQWIQSGHVHVLDGVSLDAFASDSTCVDQIPEAAFGRPLCDAPDGVRRVVGFFAPHTALMCEAPDLNRALVDLLAQLASGHGASKHDKDLYWDRLASRIPLRVRALTGL